ncbi:MAG: sarcosine oxidase subunit gamma family protein [Gammaproteobacteria bacterium]
MDQNPTQDVPARSPLHQQSQVSLASLNVEPGITLWEEALKTHLVIRGDAADDAFQKGVKAATGLAVPTQLSSAQNEHWTLSWISPDEWLLVGPGTEAFTMELALHEQLSGHYSVVNASGGQTLVRLSGEKARAVLMKSCPYDVHDRNFPVGKVVTTVFAKSQTTLRRLDENDWELVVRRSFADYVWRWLLDASHEFGLRIAAPSASQKQTSTASEKRSSTASASAVAG